MLLLADVSKNELLSMLLFSASVAPSTNVTARLVVQSHLVPINIFSNEWPNFYIHIHNIREYLSIDKTYNWHSTHLFCFYHDFGYVLKWLSISRIIQKNNSREISIERRNNPVKSATRVPSLYCHWFKQFNCYICVHVITCISGSISFRLKSIPIVSKEFSHQISAISYLVI